MDRNTDLKLRALHNAYFKSLPNKIAELESLWRALRKRWNSEQLSLLHRQVHSLHGSSATYGYPTVAQVAARLEKVLASLFKKKPSLQQHLQVQKLISKLKATIQIQTQRSSPSIFRKSETLDFLVVYLFQKDTTLRTRVSEQLTHFGYSIHSVEDFEELIECLKQRRPLAAIIDMELLNDQRKQKIKVLQNSYYPEPIPFFFIASQGDFEERLESVRLKGQAYFDKPLLIDEIITKLERLRDLESAYHVLIVEDEKDLAEYYAMLFQQSGIVVTVVTEPKKLEQTLVEFKFDLILMDIYMPGCTGIELAAFIRQQAAYEGIPIVFLSSESDKRKQVEAMDVGADDFISKSVKPEYLIQSIKNKIKRYRTLRAVMLKDLLIGVFNHTSIQSLLKLTLQSSQRLHTPVTIAMLDLDHFKQVNDRYGHLMGDQVLKHLCFLLRKRLRATDLIGRYGGEEFLIILPHTASNAAYPLIDQLRKQFAELPFSRNGKNFSVKFSAGLAMAPPHQTVVDLIQAADDALYKAKQQGGNCVCLDQKKKTRKVQ